MPSFDFELFLEYPGGAPASRVLYRGAVIRRDPHRIAARFRDPSLHTEAGTELRAYLVHQGRFSAQPARVVAAADWRSETDGELISELTLELLGEPVPTEQRGCYRVSAYGSELRVDLAGESGCQVLDISATGFSALAEGRHDVGSLVELVVRFEGEELVGLGAVQTARDGGDGKVRYGIHVATARGSRLADGMNRINLALQRRQLARLAGAS